MISCRRICMLMGTVAGVLGGIAVSAGAQDADLAKQLSNPVASLVSVPFQFNYDLGFGPDDGQRATLNIQPVIPITLNEDWNLISRTILPIIWQNDIAGPSGEQFGLGDTVQSLFLSPSTPGPGGSSGGPARCCCCRRTRIRCWVLRNGVPARRLWF